MKENNNKICKLFLGRDTDTCHLSSVFRLSNFSLFLFTNHFNISEKITKFELFFK